MKTHRIAVGLDIGTTKIVALIGRHNEFGKIEIIGHGTAPSLGVQRGVVVNITQTIESIEKAVELAQQSSGLNIKSVAVGIAGQHIRSLQHSDYITREDAEEVIEDADLDRLTENVHKLAMMPGEEIIHVLPQEYKVDGQGDIKEPRGMYAGRLEASFHIVVGQLTSIKNIARCVKSADLDLHTVNLEPLASADAVLSQEEKEAGVVLVDIGGGTTDVAIFKDGIIRHTAVIPHGGNIITSDIKEGCAIIEKQAETLKVRFGSAWPGENKENEIVAIPGLRGRDPKEISLKNLSRIIHARCSEIIHAVFTEIKNKTTSGFVRESGTWTPVVAFECRGLEPTAFYPTKGVVVTSTGGTTWRDVDLSEDPDGWFEYCENSGESVGITEFAYEFRKEKA